MKTFEVYEVKGNSNTDDGRGPLEHVAYFTREKDAQTLVRTSTFIRKYCVQSVASLHDINEFIKPVTLVICEKIEDFIDQRTVELKRSALNKLTEEERAALGF